MPACGSLHPQQLQQTPFLAEDSYFFFFAGGKTDASGSMDFPDLWWSHFPNHHQTVVDGLAVLLQSPLACQVTCV